MIPVRHSRIVDPWPPSTDERLFDILDGLFGRCIADKKAVSGFIMLACRGETLSAFLVYLTEGLCWKI